MFHIEVLNLYLNKRSFSYPGWTRPASGAIRVRSTSWNHKAPARRRRINSICPSSLLTRFRRISSPVLFTVQQAHARLAKRAGEVSWSRDAIVEHTKRKEKKMYFDIFCFIRFDVVSLAILSSPRCFDVFQPKLPMFFWNEFRRVFSFPFSDSSLLASFFTENHFHFYHIFMPFFLEKTKRNLKTESNQNLTFQHTTLNASLANK